MNCASCGHTNPERAKHLVDNILQSKSALEGERKQVTVLFADVKGSMELAEQLDAEAWHQILDRFFAILTQGVHRFEGTVNQYTGDGIRALFGRVVRMNGRIAITSRYQTHPVAPPRGLPNACDP